MAVRVVNVAGVSFQDGYPQTFYKWAMLPTHRLPACTLVREPENEHDPNCVAVKVGKKRVGALPAELAAQVAPAMDAGRGVEARILSVDVWPGNESHPSMTIEVKSTGETKHE